MTNYNVVIIYNMSIPFDPPRPRPSGGGGGGAAGFTPVLFTGGWNSNAQQLGLKAVIPDVIYSNEGITPGNGTQNIPYGYSNPTAGVSYFKVSEEMAGIYTFTIMVVALAYNNEGDDDGPTVNFERFLLGRTPGNNSIPLIKPQNNNQAHVTDPKTFLFSVTTRLIAEEQMEFKWASAFALRGGNSSNPGGWMSITKVSN